MDVAENVKTQGKFPTDPASRVVNLEKIKEQPEGLALEEARKYIYSIDFSRIISKMVNHLGWSRKHAETVCHMYRNFLFLNKKYANTEVPLPPSEDIDEFWHLHILDTKKYHQDCMAIFGRLLEHYPYFGIDEKTGFTDLGNAFEDMLRLYKKEFKGERLCQVRSARARLFGYLRVFFKVAKPARVNI